MPRIFSERFPNIFERQFNKFCNFFTGVSNFIYLIHQNWDAVYIGVCTIFSKMSNSHCKMGQSFCTLACMHVCVCAHLHVSMKMRLKVNNISCEFCMLEDQHFHHIQNWLTVNQKSTLSNIYQIMFQETKLQFLDQQPL